METNLKDLLGPGSEGLLLATELVALAHAEDAFAPQLLEQRVHGVGKGTEVRIGPNTENLERCKATGKTERQEIQLCRESVFFLALEAKIHKQRHTHSLTLAHTLIQRERNKEKGSEIG